MTARSVPVQRMPLRRGNAGTDQTISEMAKAAMGQYGAGSTKIRGLALQVVRDAGVPEKDFLGEITAIHQYVQKLLRYAFDPVGNEFVTYPETLAFEVNDGDCDDHCVLEAAMLGAIGYPTRFVTVGMSNRGMDHVYLEVMNPTTKQWTSIDPIMKKRPVGWSVPNPVLVKKYGINSADGFATDLPKVIADAAVAGLMGWAINRLTGGLGRIFK